MQISVMLLTSNSNLIQILCKREHNKFYIYIVLCFLNVRTVREAPVSKYAPIPNFFDFKALHNLQATETVKAVHI